MAADFSITLATPEDLERLLPLIAAYHAFEGIEMADDLRRQAVARLLEDPALGEIFCLARDGGLIGYIAVCFGYSIEFAGRDAFLDEFFIRAEERGKGLGRAAITEVARHLAGAGIAALHLEVANSNLAAQRFYDAQNFAPRKKYHLMSLDLKALQRS